jgi:hypothetical protein
MKKNRERDQDQKQKPRRLTLSRETIKVLDEPALLELARGGLLLASRAAGCPGGTDAC